MGPAHKRYKKIPDCQDGGKTALGLQLTANHRKKQKEFAHIGHVVNIEMQ
jgi:hypothetical protein